MLSLPLIPAVCTAGLAKPRVVQPSAVEAVPTWWPAALPGPSSAVWFWATAVLAVVLLLLAVLLVLQVRHRRRRARRRREVGPRLPVVLAHGLLGFDEVGVWPLSRHYFNGIPRRLATDGCDVHRPRVPPLGSVARRAEQLARQVRALDAPRVTIIAHSMGGLDARYAINRLGLSSKVAVLVTVGTPHRGTPIADFGAGMVGKRLQRTLDRLGFQAFADLTPLSMEAFNREIRDARGVDYASVVAVARDAAKVHPMLRPSYRWLLDHVGPNDGLVPGGSQAWGEVLAEIEADHWAQIGWGSRFSAVDFYAGLVRELRGRGY